MKFTTLLLVLSLFAHARPANAQAQAEPPKPVRAGGSIPYPTKTKDVKAEYPAEARTSGAQGFVIVEATIDPQGKVSDAHVMRPVHPALDAAALAAVKQWEFTPTIVDGKPVPVIFTATVNFSMYPGGAAAAPPPMYPPAGRVQVYMMRTQDGKSTFWEISQERADKLPDWNPRTSLPPLSVTDAMKIAEVWLKQQNPEVREFEMSSINLTRGFSMFGQRDRWYYNLYFDPIVSGKRLPGAGNFQSIVLLDGAIVEPRIEKQP